MEKHDWQNGKLLSEAERTMLINSTGKKSLKTDFTIAAVLSILEIGLIAFGIYEIFFAGKTEMIAAYPLAVVFIGIFAFAAVWAFLEAKKFHKMMMLGEFVFSREEVKDLFKCRINGLEPTFYGNIAELKLTNEVLFVRKSADDAKPTYCFLTSDKDHTQERIAEIEWKTSAELKNLEAYQKKFPEEFQKNFLWCTAAAEGVYKKEFSTYIAPKQYRKTIIISHVYAKGFSCTAMDGDIRSGEELLLYRNPEKPDEIQAYRLR